MDYVLKTSGVVTYLRGNYPMNSMSFVEHPEYLRGKTIVELRIRS